MKKDPLEMMIDKRIAVYRPKDEGGTYFGYLIEYTENELFVKSAFNETADEVCVFPRGKYDIREAK